ncbi:MAG: ribonuclease P protein component [Alcanivoracaceae bacterium]|nr:ribonuclease P protein component [Alcanivoracaceae bacterium]
MAGLPKQARLLNKADYNAVFTKSVKVSDSLFLILIHKTSNPDSRLGLVISKKVDKRAVQRNRIKRISRESFRNTTFVTSCDFVVLARPKVAHLSNKEIFSSINKLWSQAESKINRIRKK